MDIESSSRRIMILLNLWPNTHTKIHFISPSLNLKYPSPNNRRILKDLWLSLIVGSGKQQERSEEIASHKYVVAILVDCLSARRRTRISQWVIHSTVWKGKLLNIATAQPPHSPPPYLIEPCQGQGTIPFTSTGQRSCIARCKISLGFCCRFLMSRSLRSTKENRQNCYQMER